MSALAISELDVPFPPEIPRILEERQWLSRLGVQAEHLTRSQGDQYESLATSWLTRLLDLQKLWLADSHAMPPLTEQEADDLAELIEQTDLLADHRVRRRSALMKHGGSLVRRVLNVDRPAAAIYRAFNERLLGIEDRIIEGILGHSLFLRSIRADLAAEARGGPTFSDPEDLRRYLRDALAA